MPRRWTWLLAVPLVALCLLLVIAAVARLAGLWLQHPTVRGIGSWRAAETALLCVALAMPAAFRQTGFWLVLLCDTPVAGSLAVRAMPLERSGFAVVAAGAVLLLPAMLVILRACAQEDFAGLREEAVLMGAGPWGAHWLGFLRPAMPGLMRAAAWGFAAVFLLSLGLLPMLAATPPNP